LQHSSAVTERCCMISGTQCIAHDSKINAGLLMCFEVLITEDSCR